MKWRDPTIKFDTEEVIHPHPDDVRQHTWPLMVVGFLVAAIVIGGLV